MHVALSQGIIPSFAVLLTKKLVMGIGRQGYAVLFGDFRTIFFLLSVGPLSQTK